MSLKTNSIFEAILKTAEKNPNKLCVADNQNEYSYSDFVKLCKTKAKTFDSLGIKKGDCVVVEAIQRGEYLAIEFALQIIGAIFVPLENRCTAEKMCSIVDRCNAKMLVASKKIENVSCMMYEYKDFNNAIEEIDQFDLPEKDDVSEILFSTGTTGKEKGIMLTNGNSVAVAENIVYGSEMAEDNVEMIPAPINHSHGLRSCYANFLCGGTIILVDNVIDMRHFFSAMEKYKVNSIDLVPAGLTIILKLSKGKIGEYKDQLKYMEFGSAPMSAEDKKTICSLLPGTPLYNYYGSTESGRVTVYNFNQSTSKQGCIGKPTKNVDMIVVDEKLNVIKSDVNNTGLLASKGDMNMLGYWQDEEETKSVLKNGYVYTNDEAYIDVNGDIILLGRMGDVINTGGRKVSPEEIENAAKQMDDIADCGCIPIKDEIAGSVPKLYVQLNSGYELDSKKIKEFIGTILEGYKVPREVEAITKIPRSFNGKLLRRELIKINNQK